ncbi:hypothetical protein LVISKB_0955 [Levilactobacillus brevis KB290]|uniref:Uncharacterized protein n=1 Tax=Levilactobacillus brevis KB290 TaxID=1001583 RepID=M5ADV9_LEVBR|nr:hypothetical protein LVISKB_0955 [Levilactobacillus brevis KB290]GEB05739.1 hypothetical protein LBR03_06260 [Levilactobacillus brevis]GEB73763.1 hypothetical protein LBR04_05020 [Levilactobacillus brevis]
MLLLTIVVLANGWGSDLMPLKWLIVINNHIRKNKKDRRQKVGDLFLIIDDAVVFRRYDYDFFD